MARAVFMSGLENSGSAPKPNRKFSPAAALVRRYCAIAGPSARASMAASRVASGSMPWALIFASSMPVAHRSPTIFFTPVAPASAAACSANCCCTALERSSSISKAPQLVRSPGIGWAASHLLLA